MELNIQAKKKNESSVHWILVFTVSFNGKIISNFTTSRPYVKFGELRGMAEGHRAHVAFCKKTGVAYVELDDGKATFGVDTFNEEEGSTAMGNAFPVDVKIALKKLKDALDYVEEQGWLTGPEE